MRKMRIPCAAALLVAMFLSVFSGCAPKQNGALPGGSSNAPQGQSVSLLEGEEAPETEDYEPDFVSVKNVEPTFTVRVTAPADYTAEQVLAGIALNNLTNPALTDPEETDLLAPDRLSVKGGDRRLLFLHLRGAGGRRRHLLPQIYGRRRVPLPAAWHRYLRQRLQLW